MGDAGAGGRGRLPAVQQRHEQRHNHAAGPGAGGGPHRDHHRLLPPHPPVHPDGSPLPSASPNLASTRGLVLELCRGPRLAQLASLSHADCTSIWLVHHSGSWISDGSGERVGRCCPRWELQQRCWTPRTWPPWSACCTSARSPSISASHPRIRAHSDTAPPAPPPDLHLHAMCRVWSCMLTSEAGSLPP